MFFFNHMHHVIIVCFDKLTTKLSVCLFIRKIKNLA